MHRAGVAPWRIVLPPDAIEQARHHQHHKILIAGSFGMMNETQLAQRLKECACSLNPHIILSEDKAITCLALGLTPSACANHDTRELVIMDFLGNKK